MPASHAWHVRAGQIVIQTGKMRARKMARSVVASTLAPVAQRIAAVKKEPVRIADAAGRVMNGDQSVIFHTQKRVSSANSVHG